MESSSQLAVLRGREDEWEGKSEGWEMIQPPA